MVSSGPPHAGGALGQGGVVLPLLRRLCLDGERMDAAAQLLLQRLVHQTVALDQSQTLKLGTDHQDTEVGLGSWRDSMHVALVVDLQVVWSEGVCEFGSDGCLHRSAGVHVGSGVGQRPGEGQAAGGGPSRAEDTRKHQEAGDQQETNRDQWEFTGL